MATTLPTRPFGDTGIRVSILGLGAGQIGTPAMSEHDVEALVVGALDAGVTLFDTARSYGMSERRLGRVLAPYRDRVVLSTKIGYDVPGTDDWTGACIAGGIDAALHALRADYIDIVHLHSCPLEVMVRDDIVRALDDAVRAGKVRVAAYSGDNQAVDHAVACGLFGSIQTSLNMCDQRSADTVALAARRGLGVIAKRPVANAPWRYPERPVGLEADEYWLRWRELDLSPRDVPWQELALRFAAFHPGVSSAIVGTSSLAHLRANIDAIGNGPLPPDVVGEIRSAFATVGAGWPGRI